MRLAVLLVSLALGASPTLAGQVPDSTAPVAIRDTVASSSQDTAPAARKAPIGPGGAFLRSFLLPGWGQLQLHRPIPALLFLGIEGTFAGLSIKANHDVKQARLTDQSPDSSIVSAKKRAREDWLVLLGFNHLMAGLEAYVSSHLWDFPGDLRIRATPSGVGASAAIPFRLR